jgi:hypothetical protein
MNFVETKQNVGSLDFISLLWNTAMQPIFPSLPLQPHLISKLRFYVDVAELQEPGIFQRKF